MELAALDEKLEQLRQASSQVSANLLALDTEPTRELLDSIELEGLTAEGWSQSSRLLAEMFVSNHALKSLLDDASALRASWAIVTSHRLARLRALLLGCSIERSDSARSIGERELLDGSRVIARCTPDELLAEMAADFETVKAVVFAVAERWGELPQRLRCLRERIDRLGEPDLARRVGDLAQLLLVDPLAVDDELVAALDMEISGFEAVHDDADGEIAALRKSIVDLSGVIGSADDARRTAAAKFAPHHLPDAVQVDAVWSARLDDCERSAAAGAWRELPAELIALRAVTGEASARAAHVQARCQALFDERSELRGRLDALEAKAGARDRIEDPALSSLASQARDVLYTAPTDLDVARTTVDAYGDALRQRRVAP